MNCFQSQSPMIGSDFPEWHLGRRNGSFADFSSTRSGMKDFSYTNSNDVDFTPFSSVLSLSQQPSSYHDASGVSDMLSNDKTSPKTVYSSYASSSSTSTSIDPLSLVVPVPSAGIPSKNAWWSETPHQNKDQCQGTYEMVAAQDALPRDYHRQEQHWNNSWNTEGALTSNWAAQSIDPITISPKALTLNVSSAALSSSGSSQGGLLCLSDSSSGRSSGDENSDFSGPETLSVVPRPVQRPRQILPDSIPPSRRVIPSIPNNDFASSKTTQKRSMKAKSGSHRRRRSSPSRISLEAELHYQKSSAPKRIEPKPEAPSARQWTASPPSTQSAATVQAMHHRDAKDDFLVRSKLAGMSYKDIRRQGKFTEAESTLRGRFRTLTKHKTARVRKPEWDENDVCTSISYLATNHELTFAQIRLLKRAVRKLTNGSDPMKARVPWKQVADYIANNGGSYHFGNATCRKRWDELQTTGC